MEPRIDPERDDPIGRWASERTGALPEQPSAAGTGPAEEITVPEQAAVGWTAGQAETTAEEPSTGAGLVPPAGQPLEGQPGSWPAAAPSWPPLPPDLGGPEALGAGTPTAGAAPGSGGAGMPPGGEPPYSPPYGWAWPAGGAEPEHQHRRRGDKRLAVAAVAGVALLAGGLGAGLGAALGGTSPAGSPGSVALLPNETANAPKGVAGSTGAIAAAVEPAVVDINVNVASPAGYAREQASGTGMIVTSSGEVLTNNHVVEDATSVHVVVRGHGTFPARVLGVDPTADVALIQIEGGPARLPYVDLGDSSTVAVGDSVVAIGNAYGLGGSPTVVTGTVSSLDRTITASDESPTSTSEILHGLIQTSAQIAEGDSGGPLLNTKAQVIGMDTAAASGDGATLGFAIPIDTAKAIVEQIEHGGASSTVILGTSPFLGIEEEPSTGGGAGSGGFGGLPGYGQTAPAAGITLYDVVQGSPAAKAGLAAGDTITAVDGQRTTVWSVLTKLVGAKKPGDTISVSYLDSEDTSHTVRVTLAGLPK